TVTTTFERSSASGEKTMSARQRSKRPSIGVPLQAVPKPSVEPGSTTHFTGPDGAGAAAATVVAGRGRLGWGEVSASAGACRAAATGGGAIPGSGGVTQRPKAITPTKATAI